MNSIPAAVNFIATSCRSTTAIVVAAAGMIDTAVHDAWCPASVSSQEDSARISGLRFVNP